MENIHYVKNLIYICHVHCVPHNRKECAETIFWLEVLAESKIIDQEKLKILHEDAEKIGRILTSIIKKKISNQ